MPGALEALDEVLTLVDGGGVTASEAIEQLMGAQISLRNNRRLQAAMRSSRLPAMKTLEDFDCSFQPSIEREQIDSLHELGFLARKENVILPASARRIWPSALPLLQPRAAVGSTTAPWPISSPHLKRPRPLADSAIVPRP